MHFSTFLETQLLNTILRSAEAYKPPAVYAALFTDEATDAPGGPEVSAPGYARAQITQADANWTTPAIDLAGGSSTLNAIAITFPKPSGDWGRVTHIALYDAATDGNKLVWGPLIDPKNINNGDPSPVFKVNSISWRLD